MVSPKPRISSKRIEKNKEAFLHCISFCFWQNDQLLIFGTFHLLLNKKQKTSRFYDYASQNHTAPKSPYLSFLLPHISGQVIVKEMRFKFFPPMKKEKKRITQKCLEKNPSFSPFQCIFHWFLSSFSEEKSRNQKKEKERRKEKSLNQWNIFANYTNGLKKLGINRWWNLLTDQISALFL